MTDLDLRAGQIHRGLGVVARWPDIALVIPSHGAHDLLVDEMFASLDANPTSQTVIRAINSLLSENRLRSMGMVVEATGGPMGVVFGPVEILIDGELVLSGHNGVAKEQLSNKAQRITIRAANLSKAAEPVPPFDLRRGVAPGAGLSLISLPGSEPPGIGDMAPPTSLPAQSIPRSSAQPEAEPVGREPDAGYADVGHFQAVPAGGDATIGEESLAAPFRSVLLLDVDKPTEVTPLPVSRRSEDGDQGDQASPMPKDPGRVEVEGILCSRGHFNNPRSAYCMVCGMSMLHLTPNPVVRPRPTLGFIVFDDGSSFGLDRSYVIGREPKVSGDSSAELLTVHDNNDTLSRTHAELRLTGWTVQLFDMESTNGTYIWDATNERWNQLTPGHPVELRSGETVALGRRTFVFESVSRT